MQTKSNNISRTAEQFSALLDGEISEQELDELLPNIANNPVVQRQAAQWNLIGDALRAGLPAVDANNPAAKTEADDNVIRPAASVWQRWSKPADGFAVAAGVAAVAILVGQQPELQPNTANSFASAPTISIAPTGDNSAGLLSAEQLRNVVAASSNKPISEITPYELARMARVDASMNEVELYQPITREELLELQQPLNGDPTNR